MTSFKKITGPAIAAAAAIVGAAFVMAAGPLQAGGEHDWLIVPGERFGPVTAKSTMADLRRAFGAGNVKPDEIAIGEGETLKGARVYAATANEIEIIWKEKSPTPLSVTTYGKGGKWKTAGGLRIGSTLAEVEAANGRAFKLYGFGWDYGGRVAGWKGGKLPEAIYMDFEATVELGKQADLVMGDREFASDLPVMKKTKPVVRRISVEFK